MTTGGAKHRHERERAFDVPEDWVLPDPSRFVPDGGSVRARTVEVESIYFDTATHDLFVNQLTLRRRTGARDDGWQLRLPGGDLRGRIRLPLDGAEPPDELQHLTHGVRRGAPLHRVASVHTRRDVRVITDADGSPVVEMAVADVSASVGGNTALISRWREVEVELKHGDPALLRTLSKWLRRSGATTGRAGSKLARALGNLAKRPKPSPAVSSETVHGAVVRYLAEQYVAILEGDVALRCGQDAVHRTRVATRRYRSVLRVFGEVLDAGRAAALDTELKWYADVLGNVRDLHVMREHLVADLDEEPDELILGPVVARLETTFNLEIAAAARELDAAMRSERYLAMLEELHAWLVAPPLTGRREGRAELARYLRKSQRKYEKRLAAAERLDDADPRKNGEMHGARKAAKRSRYTAELCVPALGKPARRVRKRAKALQQRLGDRQDAVMAAQFLRRAGAAAGTTHGENGFTYGVLLGRELRRGHMRHL